MTNPENKMNIESEHGGACGSWKADFRDYLTEMYGERNKINPDHLLNLNGLFYNNAMKKKIMLFSIREMQINENIQIGLTGTQTYSKPPDAKSPNMTQPAEELIELN